MFRSRNIFAFVVAVSLMVWMAPRSEAGKNALAILNLRPTNIEAMGYDGEILYALISALEKQKTIEVMPRREMEEQLFQAGLVQGDTPEMAMAAGKALGINFILFGRVTKKGGLIESDVSLMNVEQKQVIKSWRETFSGREDILARAPKFAGELSSAILNREQLPAPTTSEIQPDVSIENLRAKSKGKKVVLTWKFDPAKPITGFHVYRSENPQGPYQFFGKTDRNIFEDSKIKKRRSYFYQIGILHSSGQEIKSPHTAEIKNAGERTPHPPLLMGGNSYIQRTEIRFVPSLLNDQEKFKIKQYKIYKKIPDGDSWENISTISAKVTSQSGLGFTVEDDKNLEDGKAYAYAVSSVDNKNRESPLSDPLLIKTMIRPVLSVEKDNLLRKSALSWEVMENVEGYYLYRKIDQEKWLRVGKIRGGSKSQFTDDKDLSDGQEYQHYLTAYDTRNETGPSNVVQVKTKSLPPFPQDLLPQSEMVKSVQLSWTPVDDPDIGGHAIYRGPSRKELKLLKKVNGYKSHSYLDKGTGYSPLEDGGYYFYAVASYNLFGAEGKISPAQIARTKPRPASVKNFMVSAEQDSILVRWDKNPEADIESYILYRSKNKGSFSKIKALGLEETRYTDHDLKPESQYRYRMIAVDKDGLKSDPVDSDAIPSPIVKSEG